MAFQDLRGFIDEVEQLGELQIVEGADWDKEIGALTELMAERRGPALLFDNIKGYPKGYRILTNAFSSLKRTALVLGTPLDLTPLGVLDTWRRSIRDFKPLPPREVKRAPVKENVLTGKDVNLFNFPAPVWHERDGGRFLGTGTAVITRDPDEGWVNLGAHRCQIKDKNLISVNLARGHHARIMMDKYHARGQSCPIAICLGQDPVLYLAAGTSLTGWGTSEYELAGWARNTPIEVVRGDTTDLPIPATAELVLEGEIPPPSGTGFPLDGPFGEWVGHDSSTPSPVVVVKSILHRNDPIILGAPTFRPPIQWHFAVPLTAGLTWNALEASGVPGVTGVWHGLEAWGPLWLVVRLKQSYAGHAKQAALAATGCRPGCYGGKFVIVVDHDIDITDNADVMWAMMSRANVENIDIVHGSWTTGADLASVTHEAKAAGLTVSAKVIIDACWPWERSQPFAQQTRFSPAYLEKTRGKWAELFNR